MCGWRYANVWIYTLKQLQDGENHPTHSIDEHHVEHSRGSVACVC
jgi:hypothetical protein